MVKLYADKIEAGGMTIDQVPMTWRSKVESELIRREEERNHVEFDAPVLEETQAQLPVE